MMHEADHVAMTGRERVGRALAFQSVDRIPRDIWLTPIVQRRRKASVDTLLQRFPLDFTRAPLSWGKSRQASILSLREQPVAGEVQASTGVGVGADEFRSSFAAQCLVGTFRDEWGSQWRSLEAGVIGEVMKPAIEDWSQLASYAAPYELLEGLDVSASHAFYAQSDRFVIAHSAVQPFQRLMFLRTLQQLMLDIGSAAPELEDLLRLIHEYNVRELTLLAAATADAIAFKDDWGTQTSLLISPRTWRRLFKPLYAEYCDIIHAAGKKAFFHSDGCIAAIYPDLIEVGIDAINSQLFCMDIEALAAQARGRITLWGEIDRQNILARGTPLDVRRAVERVWRAFGGGGLIAQCVWGADTPTGNVESVLQSWLDVPDLS
jgi:uroporphyrinogen decarboxylase